MMRREIIFQIAVSALWVFIKVLSVPDADTEVISVLDIGQGDAILVQFPEGTTMLVDGGPGARVLSEVGDVLVPWERNIDIVVLTHDHDDHFNGLFDIFFRYQVGVLLVREKKCQSIQCKSLLELATKRGVIVVDVEEMENGTKVIFGGAQMSILYSSGVTSGDSVNNASIVIITRYSEFSALLTGDLEKNGEIEIISKFADVFSDNLSMLKAGHHCSRTASSDELLNAVKPVLAVCSVGEGNRFDHPHKETLEKFRERGVSYLRTDLNGRITIETDGRQWRVGTGR